MKNHRIVTMLLLAVYSLASCGDSKNSGEKSANEGQAKKEEKSIVADIPDDFKAFDLNGIKARWQGAWVVSNQGRLEAWEVEGDRIKVFNGKEEQEHGFVVYSPCQVGVHRVNERGQSVDIVNFSLDGDEMRAGTASSAGYRVGDQMAACTTDGVWLGKGESCVLWKKELGDGAMVWVKEEAECGTLNKPEYGDFVTMKAASKSRGTELKIDGQALISGNLKPMEKLGSLAEAKAKLGQ